MEKKWVQSATLKSEIVWEQKKKGICWKKGKIIQIWITRSINHENDETTSTRWNKCAEKYQTEENRKTQIKKVEETQVEEVSRNPKKREN